MDDWARSRITDWDDAPFDGGVDGLHELADTGFTGAVEAGSLWVLMLNGRVVGRFGGALDSIGPTGTAYDAPDASLPLLFAMLERGGEEEGQYYTEQTSLTSVHQSLEDAGFVGYLLLSEHVLSGDYYVVYYGERSLPVAFIGASERLVTGEDAFELAADEVGIYEVRSVDIEVEALPPRPSVGEPDAVEAGEDSADGSRKRSGGLAESTGATESAPSEGGEPGVATAEQPRDAADEPVSSEAEIQSALPGTDEDQSDDETAETADSDAGPSTTEGRSDRPPSEDDDIPVPRDDRSSAPESPPPAEADDDPPSGVGPAPVTDDDSSRGITISSAAIERELETELTDLKQYRDALLDRVDELELTREEFKSELATLAEDHRSLEATVEALESNLADSASIPGDAAEPTGFDRSIPVTEALAQTHLFVRYDSNDGATLRRVGSGDVTPEAVRENLIIEGHTEFDADAIAIEGQPFERFLDERLEMRVARWLVEGLPFKLAESSARDGLGDLLKAVTNIDRIDFNAAVDGIDDHRFDVVGRDRMGAPVLVAEVDGDRQATSVDAIRTLLDGATEASKHADELAAALLVTGSYFDPDVIEAADEATSSGLLSRNDRSSYVHVSRNVGYHLLLVEYRSEAAHVTKPAL